MLFKKDASADVSDVQTKARSAGLSMLSTGCRFEGRVCLHGHARIGGQIDGTIVSSASLVIEQTSLIRGDINGTQVLVNGRVEGNVVATEVLRLSPSSVVTGDLCAKRLIVEDGACIEGRISRLDPNEAAKVRSLPIASVTDGRRASGGGRNAPQVPAEPMDRTN